MSANAKFNCLYCVICVLYPINSCIWRPSYHFCSVIFTAQLVQYYKIVVIAPIFRRGGENVRQRVLSHDDPE
jgi:hypothetical protein